MEKLWIKCSLFAAQGLRSISIVNLHQKDAFPAGIPSNWRNLNHLFIHSSICPRLVNQILSHCCNLVACLLLVAMPRNDRDVYTSLATPWSFCLPHLKFLSLHGDPTVCSHVFRNIEAQSLRILHCNGHYYTTISPGLFHFPQSIKSLDTLVIDWQDLSTPSYCEAEYCVTALYENKHQYSPDSAPTVPFPSLEVLEAYHMQITTDAALLDHIIARIDATRSNASVSKPRKVLVQFQRSREIDIVPETLAYAQAAGIELELELTYVEPFIQKYEQSYRSTANKHGDSWMYSSYDFCFDM